MYKLTVTTEEKLGLDDLDANNRELANQLEVFEGLLYKKHKVLNIANMRTDLHVARLREKVTTVTTMLEEHDKHHYQYIKMCDTFRQFFLSIKDMFRVYRSSLAAGSKAEADFHLDAIQVLPPVHPLVAPAPPVPLGPPFPCCPVCFLCAVLLLCADPRSLFIPPLAFSMLPHRSPAMSPLRLRFHLRSHCCISNSTSNATAAPSTTPISKLGELEVGGWNGRWTGGGRPPPVQSASRPPAHC